MGSPDIAECGCPATGRSCPAAAQSLPAIFCVNTDPLVFCLVQHGTMLVNPCYCPAATGNGECSALSNRCQMQSFIDELPTLHCKPCLRSLVNCHTKLANACGLLQGSAARRCRLWPRPLASHLPRSRRCMSRRGTWGWWQRPRGQSRTPSSSPRNSPCRQSSSACIALLLVTAATCPLFSVKPCLPSQSLRLPYGQLPKWQCPV